MLSEIIHRGPDSSSIFHDKNYTAGMRRLSIIDLSGGDQPFYNEDKNIVVIYNGEIYNFENLKTKLISSGHKFRCKSDGEVICHLYEEYGEKFTEKLDGMFAIALWDKKEQKLILARDIPGEKPLYYSSLSNGDIVFSSEIKSIVKFPEIDLSLNYQAIWDMPTFLWIPEPDTIYENIKAILPGHLLISDSKGIRIKKYENQFEKDLNLEGKNEKEIVSEVRRITEKAIESRLMSDAPVGSFLSSGLDSSIISTIAVKKLKKLDTFTVGFENIDDPYHGKSDESVYASEYAKKIGSNHHTILVTGKKYLDDLDDFVKFGDQPWGVSSGLGVMAVAKAARELGIKVLLTGDAADECFGGYSWYFHLKNNIKAKSSDSEKDVTFQNFGLPVEKRLETINSYDSHKKAWAWHYYASENEKKNIFNGDLFGTVRNSHRWFEEFNNKKEWLPKDFILQDQNFYLTNEMLRKADRMTMAHSVEGRVPFAAPGVLNLAKKLPIELLVRRDRLKWVLREAFSDMLPPEITSRAKHGFNHPIDHWLKNEWSHLVDETFSENSTISKLGIIRKNCRSAIDKMLFDNERLNGHTIFCFIMLDRWLNEKGY
jgi:asparagine synthase (glutamine-hydrolysing)